MWGGLLLRGRRILKEGGAHKKTLNICHVYDLSYRIRKKNKYIETETISTSENKIIRNQLYILPE